MTAMQTFYEPRGAAREYAPLALNLYNGCSHGCTYCFAPACVRRSREDFHTNVTPRKGIVEAVRKYLQKEVPKQTVLLSFTSDPYQPLERELRITRGCLEEMREKNMDVAILTKGSIPKQDFPLIIQNWWKVGTTFSCWSMEFENKYEPFTLDVVSRRQMLEYAEERGVKTFASIEPVLSELELSTIFKKIEHFRLAAGVFIGKWNHDKEADKIDWKAVLQMSIDFANRTGHKVYIKDALAKYGDVPPHLRVRPFG